MSPHHEDTRGAIPSTGYGKAVVDGLLQQESKPTAPAKSNKDEIQLVLQTFRLLVADLCQQFNMGHPGGAIGMAAIGVALWKYVMKYAPHQPDWFNRDRFVLSNGLLVLHSILRLLTVIRTCVFVSVHQFAPHGLQVYDLGAIEVISFRKSG